MMKLRGSNPKSLPVTDTVIIFTPLLSVCVLSANVDNMPVYSIFPVVESFTVHVTFTVPVTSFPALKFKTALLQFPIFTEAV